MKVVVNGAVYDPLSFKSFRPNPQNISEFYQAGVRLFSVLTTGLISALGVPYSLFGESMYRARKSAKLATLCLSDIRRTLAECGCAYELYSMGDFEQVDLTRYKLIVFVNTYDLPTQKRKVIADRLCNSGKTALWLYAPAYATRGCCEVNEIEKVTHIHVSKSTSTHGGLVFEDTVARYDLSAPYFAIDDVGATTIAYFEDGAIAVAERIIDGYRSVYVATCNLPSVLLRKIARSAGAFVYSEYDRIYVYPNSSSVGVYNAMDGEAIVALREDGDYRDLIGGQIYRCLNGRICLPPKPIRAYLLVKEN